MHNTSLRMYEFSCNIIDAVKSIAFASYKYESLEY